MKIFNFSKPHSSVIANLEFQMVNACLKNIDGIRAGKFRLSLTDELVKDCHLVPVIYQGQEHERLSHSLAVYLGKIK